MKKVPQRFLWFCDLYRADAELPEGSVLHKWQHYRTAYSEDKIMEEEWVFGDTRFKIFNVEFKNFDSLEEASVATSGLSPLYR